MGRPRKRQRDDDHMQATSNTIKGLQVGVPSGIDSPTLRPDSTSIPDFAAGAIESLRRYKNVESQDLQPASEENGAYINQPDTHGFEIPSSSNLDPLSNTPAWDLAMDPSVFMPMNPLISSQTLGSFDLVNNAANTADPLNAQNGCSCLGNLYSILATFQSLPPASFPFSISALKKATQRGYEAVRCQTCPLKFNTAVQNIMLLTTLLQMLINEYSKLIRHIEERSSSGEKIPYRIGEARSCFDQRHTGTLDCPMNITIDLDGEEWRMLAMKAVRQEVVGSGHDDVCLRKVLEEMRKRQGFWHGNFAQGENPFDGLTNHNKSENRPQSERCNAKCLQLEQINHLERMLELLKV